MLNSSTINKLDKMGFGLNIDKIELFIKYFKLSRTVSNLDRYEYTYLQLLKIMKDIKPNSKVFSGDAEAVELKSDEFDKLFRKYSNNKCITAYGKNDEKELGIVKEINFEEDSCVDLIAVNNVEGIDIMCTYINGRVYRIYAISESDKLYDFTAQLNYSVPQFVEELACYNLVELRGKATITKNKPRKFNSVACSTLYNILNNTDNSDITIIFDNILFEDGFNTFDNNWDKIEWLRDIGFSVPHHALIRNVDKVQFESALEEFDNYFRNEESQTIIVYNKLGFNVKNNKSIDNAEYMICYDTDNVNYKTKFEATVKDVCVDIDKSYIKIVGTKCNNGILIESIDIDDLYYLDKYNITIGNKIKFIVVENAAIIVD